MGFGIVASPPVHGTSGVCVPVYVFLSWLHLLWFTGSFLGYGIAQGSSVPVLLFHLSAWLLYSLLYLLPVIVLIQLARKIAPTSLLAVSIVAVTGTVLLLVLIRIDSMIYDLYGFHINSFVLNLVLTPGGIDSLGSDSASLLSMFLLVLRILAIQTALLAFSIGLKARKPCRTPSYWRLAAAVSMLFLVQGSVYGISDVSNYGPVLDSSRAYPLFQRVRFRTLARNFGFTRQNRTELFAGLDTSLLNYPRGDVAFSAVEQPPNIIMLVAESLRWDQLQPETMPNTWVISKQGLYFNRHYSSGNGTREALFGMFYGLFGSYWENFMHAGQAPLLMQRIQDLHYQLDVRTSASFTYPEFDKTLFSALPDSVMHTADSSLPPWQRDQNNTDALLDFLENRDPARPFMEFFFFESTHASYSFPEESALLQDYQTAVDYTQLSRAELADGIGPLLNRYRNAAHWVDIQLGRIYRELEKRHLLQNTIVVITGDHGEEFMEKGAWGHNSSFVEEQIRVPLVVLWPGEAPAVTERHTSHIDIATTLLQALGAPGDTTSYSLGMNLLEPGYRDHLVVSDWHSIGVMTDEMKYRIPYLVTAGANYWAPTDKEDRPLPGPVAEDLLLQHRDLLLQAMAACSLFTTGLRDR